MLAALSKRAPVLKIGEMNKTRLAHKPNNQSGFAPIFVVEDSIDTP